MVTDSYHDSEPGFERFVTSCKDASFCIALSQLESIYLFHSVEKLQYKHTVTTMLQILASSYITIFTLNVIYTSEAKIINMTALHFIKKENKNHLFIQRFQFSELI